MALDPVSITAIVLGTLGTADQAIQSRKQAKSVEKAEDKLRKAEEAAQQMQAARERRKQIHQARVKRAQIENVAATTGQAFSSAPQAGASSVSAQAGSNIAELSNNILMQNRMTAAKETLQRAQRPSTDPLRSAFHMVSNAATQGLLSAAGQQMGHEIGSLFDTAQPDLLMKNVGGLSKPMSTAPTLAPIQDSIFRLA